MKEPSQQIYDAIYAKAVELGYKVYPYNPDASATYPFVVIGDTQLVPFATKTMLLGRVFIDISVWGLHSKRKTVSDMTNELYKTIRLIKTTDSLFWSVDDNASTIRMITDTSTNTPLYRGLLQLEIQFN